MLFNLEDLYYLENSNRVIFKMLAGEEKDVF